MDPSTWLHHVPAISSNQKPQPDRKLYSAVCVRLDRTRPVRQTTWGLCYTQHHLQKIRLGQDVRCTSLGKTVPWPQQRSGHNVGAYVSHMCYNNNPAMAGYFVKTHAGLALYLTEGGGFGFTNDVKYALEDLQQICSLSYQWYIYIRQNQIEVYFLSRNPFFGTTWSGLPSLVCFS